MNKRPVLFGLAAMVLICLTLALLDAVTVVTRPLLPWFAWMFP